MSLGLGTSNSLVGPDFDLVCPACSARCVGKTYPSGAKGTYLNLYVRYRVQRIICSHCGLVRELPAGTATLEHRFWFRIQLGENVLWAENETRLRAIREVLAGNAENHTLYALPQWLIQRGTAVVAVEKIDQFLANPSERRISDA